MQRDEKRSRLALAMFRSEEQLHAQLQVPSARERMLGLAVESDLERKATRRQLRLDEAPDNDLACMGASRDRGVIRKELDFESRAGFGDADGATHALAMLALCELQRAAAEGVMGLVRAASLALSA